MSDSTEPPRPSRRRRVFVTAGLSASAAVLAMAVQAGTLGQDDDEPAPASYGESAASGDAGPDAGPDDVDGA